MPVGHGRRSSAARLEDAPPTDLASLNWYTVKKGETLATIARKLRVSRTDLAEANYLKANAARGGRPEADGAARGDGADGGADRAAGRRSPSRARSPRSDAVVPAMDSASDRPRQGPLPASSAATRSPRSPGCSSTTLSALQTWNGIDGHAHHAGERLTIYAVARQLSTARLEAPISARRRRCCRFAATRAALSASPA